MEIKIQIGDEEFKNDVKAEIEAVINSKILKNTDDLVIIVPENFDEEVKRISGDELYVSRRTEISQFVMGITFPESKTIIFNGNLYSPCYDFHIRCSIYFHELFHLYYSKPKFSLDVNDKQNAYLTFIESHKEEFSAIRYGLEVTKEIFDNNLSEIYKNYIQEVGRGHLNNLLNKEYYHENFEKLIYSYQIGNIKFDDFLARIGYFIRKYTLELFSFYNYLEIYSNYFSLELPDDILFNSDTKGIYEILKMGIFDYNFEIESKMDRFFRSFGLEYSNTKDGLYIGVNNLNTL